MNHPNKPLAAIAMAAACLILPLLTGCEKDPAASDRRVRRAMDESAQIMATPNGKIEDALKALEPAVGEQYASDIAKALANAEKGRLAYVSATDLMPQLADQEAAIYRRLDEIERLGWQIADNNLAIAAFSASNPANGPTAAFKDTIDQANKEAAAADKLIQETNTKIAAQTAKIKGLETARNTASTEAANLLKQSEQAKGQESVDLFKKGQDARKRASDNAHQLAVAQIELAALQAQAALGQKQKQLAQEAIASARGEITKLDANWTATGKAIAQRQADSKRILDQITVQVQGLGKAVAEADKLRSAKDSASVLGFLATAQDSYHAAYEAMLHLDGALNQLLIGTTSPNSPSRRAWEELRLAITAGSTYDLGRARAILSQGDVHLAHRYLLLAEQRLITGLAPVLVQAKLPLPSGLNSVAIRTQLNRVEADARTAFTTTQNLFVDDSNSPTPVYGPSPVAERAEADTYIIAARYGLWCLTHTNSYLEGARVWVKRRVDESNGAVLIAGLPGDLEVVTGRKSVVPPGAGGGASLPPPPPVRPGPPDTTPTPPPPTGEKPKGVLGKLSNAFGGGRGLTQMGRQPTNPQNPPPPVPAP